MYGFYIGWTDEFPAQYLPSQGKVCDHDGAEVIFSLILEKDFSWCLFFRRQLRITTITLYTTITAICS